MFLDRSEMPAPARHALSLWVTLLERDACRRADAILETNATRAERFRQQGRCPVLVPNYPPLELLPEPAEEREPCIVYTGLVSPHRGFEKLLEALALVKVEHPSVRLRVIGGFETRDGYEERVSDMVSRRELVASVEFTGPLPYQEMFGRLRSCLAGVVLLQPGRGNDYTGLPNKLFEFMGSGLAVVASDFPELARVVRDTGCGWLVDPTRPEKVAQALNRVLAEPAESKRRGRLGREAVRSRFHWGMAEAALLKVYQEMLSS
jgi:glycosyltransferase involved in cell wall biosynthesis